jgi:hypothetical protein
MPFGIITVLRPCSKVLVFYGETTFFVPDVFPERQARATETAKNQTGR